MTTSPQGVLDLDSYDLAATVRTVWDGFVALVDDADLATPTRLSGWTVREVALHLGTWDGRSALSEVVASLGDAADRPFDPDAFNRDVLAERSDATDDEVRAALHASRDAVTELLASDLAAERGREPVSSVLGPLPLLTVVHAGCYELAVHALDVALAVDADVPADVLAPGVAALVDTVGALAARSGIDATVQVVGDGSGWITRSADGGWTLESVDERRRGLPGVHGSRRDVLDAAAGRAQPALLVARGRLHVSDAPGLLPLVPILDQVPGVAGAGAIKIAAKSLSGVTGLLGRLTGR